MVIKMPKDRNPWLADDVLPEKKTLDVMHRITMMVLIILVWDCLHLWGLSNAIYR